MDYKIGDFIRPTDEDDVYQIDSISEMFGKSYMGRSIKCGHTRGFDINAKHYHKATQTDIENALEEAPLYYSFWISNKKNEIVSNGHVFANSLEDAKRIFNGLVNDTKNVGEYYMSEAPLEFIKNHNQ